MLGEVTTTPFDDDDVFARLCLPREEVLALIDTSLWVSNGTLRSRLAPRFEKAVIIIQDEIETPHFIYRASVGSANMDVIKRFLDPVAEKLAEALSCQVALSLIVGG